MILPLSANSLPALLEETMIDRRTIFEVHRMSDEGLSVRKIARTLHLSRKSVTKYLKYPSPKKPVIRRESNLDPFKD